MMNFVGTAGVFVGQQNVTFSSLCLKIELQATLQLQDVMSHLGLNTSWRIYTQDLCNAVDAAVKIHSQSTAGFPLQVCRQLPVEELRSIAGLGPLLIIIVFADHTPTCLHVIWRCRPSAAQLNWETVECILSDSGALDWSARRLELLVVFSKSHGACREHGRDYISVERGQGLGEGNTMRRGLDAQHCTDKYKHRADWMINLDIDVRALKPCQPPAHKCLGPLPSFDQLHLTSAVCQSDQHWSVSIVLIRCLHHQMPQPAYDLMNPSSVQAKGCVDGGPVCSNCPAHDQLF